MSIQMASASFLAFSTLLVHFATAGSSDSCRSEAAADVDSDGLCDNVNLLQLDMKMRGLKGSPDDSDQVPPDHANRIGDAMALEQAAESCALMDNHEVYFSINVTIGSASFGEPDQTFALVADTGSNALIVPGCSCKISGGCSRGLDCFDENKSSSFELVTTNKSGKVTPLKGELSYGSGNIIVGVSSDLAEVGGVIADMKKGVFLMLDRKKLQIDGDFEGILGLGLPGSQGDAPLFPEVAKVNKYTLCFNDGVKPGVLKMNVPELASPMTNIGQVHWGFDLQGMSVGSESAPVLFCSDSSKKPGMKTACGAIPDSGTTLIMGPKDQINKLQEVICDQWPRCKTTSMSSPNVSKVRVFNELLLNCSDWLKESPDEFSAMPPLYITLAGAEGIPQTIELPATTYLIETEMPETRNAIVKILGLPLEVPIPTGKMEKVCIPSFGPQDYNTLLNGPVWILGTPLFYSHTVGYDIGAKPPKISVESKPCTECGGSQQLSAKQDGVPRSLRKLNGPLRHKKWLGDVL